MNEKKQNPFAKPVKTNTHKTTKFEPADIMQQAQTFLSWKIFNLGNRIGRLRYLSFTLAAIFIGAALGLLVFLIPVIGYMLSALLLIATYISVAILTIKRCHDFNMHTILALALLFFFPISVIIYCFIPGNTNENKYGTPPPENTTAVVVFACLFPILYGLALFALISLTFSVPLCIFCS